MRGKYKGGRREGNKGTKKTTTTKTTIIIIIILGISFMQGIYTYIPETNHVPRERCVATILM
jgi:hypothetical protein